MRLRRGVASPGALSPSTAAKVFSPCLADEETEAQRLVGGQGSSPVLVLEPGLDPDLRAPQPGPWPRVALPSLPAVPGEAGRLPGKVSLFHVRVYDTK